MRTARTGGTNEEYNVTEFNKFEYHKSLRGADLDNPEYRVLATLWDYADADGRNARPSQERLMADCRMSESSIYRAMKRLTAKGWIRQDAPARSSGRNGGGGWAASYSLTTPAAAVPEESPVTADGSFTAESPVTPDGMTRQSERNDPSPVTESPVTREGPSDHYQIKRKDQGKDQQHYSSNPETCVGTNSGGRPQGRLLAETCSGCGQGMRYPDSTLCGICHSEAEFWAAHPELEPNYDDAEMAL
jgi:predicted transcriptional regulator